MEIEPTESRSHDLQQLREPQDLTGRPDTALPGWVTIAGVRGRRNCCGIWSAGIWNGDAALSSSDPNPQRPVSDRPIPFVFFMHMIDRCAICFSSLTTQLPIVCATLRYLGMRLDTR
jgi:hypothetical protein